MAATDTIIFADGMSDIAVANGVVRITLAQSGSEGRANPVGQLCVPVTQLPAITSGLIQMLRQLEAKAKELKATQEPVSAEVPAGSFRFDTNT
ncbi:MAG TPA: hypothetical protein VGM87_21710 [Roseomonas sp.]|jgi:hypothetical protein